MIEADVLIFDLDGTLIDSREDIADAVNHTRKTLGLRPLDLEVVTRAIGDGVYSLMTRILGPENLELKDRALAVFREYYGRHLLNKTRLVPSAAQTLEHFRDKRKAILTNKPRQFTLDILKGLGIEWAFEIVECGDSPETKKPNPAGAHRILDHFGVGPDQAVLIGDSPVDIRTARAAGMPVCIVLDGYTTQEAVRDLEPDLVVQSISEVKEHIF